MTQVQRYHALDALRAALMLLGVVLHSMASYSTFPLSDGWPFKDAHTSQHLNLPVFVIHVFRMPAFFALAGFFAAVLHDRGGIRALAVNRARRVLLPLIVFWLALAPLVGGGFLFAIHRGTGTPIADIVAASAATATVNTMHLWFLYYLVLFYAVAIAIVWMGRGATVPVRLCVTLATSWWTPLLWGTVTTAILVRTPSPVLDGSSRLLPPLESVAGFGVFFLFGWMLFRGRHRLSALVVRAWLHLAVGAAAMTAFVALELMRPPLDPRWMHAVRCAVVALSSWSLLLGLVGICLRYLTRERPALTYLSQSSYWVYLVHLPIVIVLAGVLAPTPLHAIVKFAIVVAVTSVASLATYHYGVRQSAVGLFLNGRRLGGSRPATSDGAFA